MRRRQIKTHMNVLRYQIKERAFDLWNITLPIFLTVGLIMGSVRAWAFLLGFDL